VLAGGLAQHRYAFAVEEEDRAQVDRQLHVDVLRLHLCDLCAGAHTGVVDEHVEASVSLAVRVDDLLDLSLIGDVDGERLDFVSALAQLGDRSFELLWTP
jgi:hypothetical protein